MDTRGRKGAVVAYGIFQDGLRETTKNLSE
jgi:hypothetical protein